MWRGYWFAVSGNQVVFITIIMKTFLFSITGVFLEWLCKAWGMDRVSLGPRLLSFALITHDQKQLGEGRIYLPYTSWCCSSLMEVRAGTMEKCCLPACSPSPAQPASYTSQGTCVGVALRTVTWALLRQSSIKEMSYKYAHRLVWLRQFLLGD